MGNDPCAASLSGLPSSRFQPWCRAGVVDRLLEALAKELEQRGKGSRIMVIADRAGLPVALCTASAAPHETTFVSTIRPLRLVTRRERYATNCLASLKLAAFIFLAKRHL